LGSFEGERSDLISRFTLYRVSQVTVILVFVAQLFSFSWLVQRPAAAAAVTLIVL
jgi:hypothetical protein